MTGREAVELLKETYTDWNQDKAPRLGAALAYYTAFAMAPLLVAVLGIVGLVLDRTSVLQNIVAQMQTNFGEGAASMIEEMISKSIKPNETGTHVIATVVGLGTALFGAAGLFGQLQDALNTIWGVQPKPGIGFMGMLRARFLSFAMVLGTCFLLLVSLALSAAISALQGYLDSILAIPSPLLELVNFVVSFGIITVLFASIFRVLPDAEVQWHDVWIGAAITALLFVVGKFALGWYLGGIGKSNFAAFGAAGSLMVILFWVYYAAQILFFGAEFTKVYARNYGSKIVPSPYAEAVTAEARAEQGLQGPSPLTAPHPAASGSHAPPGFAAGSPQTNRSPVEQGYAAALRPDARRTLEEAGAVLAGLGLIFLLARVFRCRQ